MKLPIKTLLCLLATLPAAYAGTIINGDTSGNSGDASGNARGTNSIDIQATRSILSEVVSGDESVALGTFQTVESNLSTAIGSHNSVTNNPGLAFGYANTVANSGYGDTTLSGAFGYNNWLTGSNSYSFGAMNVVTANNATAFGSGIANNIYASTMIGPSNTAKITILESGVGIGTTAPAARLHVEGDLKVTGTIINPSLNSSVTALNTTVSGLNTSINALNSSIDPVRNSTGNGNTSRLLVGGSNVPPTALSSAWQGTSVVGADGQNKVVSGFLSGETNGATIGAHNSDQTAWADLNLNAQNLIFRSGGEGEKMRIDSLGNVGIGTSIPLASLDIVKYGSTGTSIRLAAINSTPFAWPIMYFSKSGGTEAVPSDISETQNNQKLASTIYSGRFGGGTRRAADVTVAVDGTPNSTTGFLPGKYEIKVADGVNSSTVSRLAITANGNVGLSKSIPTARLDVNGDAKIATTLSVGGNVTVVDGDITMKSHRVIRVSPAGDVLMGNFANGSNPAN